MGTHTHIKAFSYVIIQINGCQQLFYKSKKSRKSKNYTSISHFSYVYFFSIFIENAEYSLH